LLENRHFDDCRSAVQLPGGQRGMDARRGGFAGLYGIDDFRA
jgi:hypothetical protein